MKKVTFFDIGMDNLDEKIKSFLNKLEENYDIKIIYAAETGSRAWRLDSRNSDYDIKFIYVNNNKKTYFSLKPVKETICGFSEDCSFDWSGWDISKALKLVHSMNPSIVELLNSTKVYIENEKFCQQLNNLLLAQKRSAPLIFHFKSMAKSIKEKTSKSETIDVKKYLSIIRPAGLAVWLVKCRCDSLDQSKLLEVDFNKVLADLKSHMSLECYRDILELVELKKSNNPETEIKRSLWVEDWIENNVFKISSNEIKSNFETTQHICDITSYDQIFYEILNVDFNKIFI